MNCWELLGIEPTTSTLAIKKAYTTLLRSCNPEDKPEEFKELRKAYQAALKESRQVESNTAEHQNHRINTPLSDQPNNTEQAAESNQTENISEVALLIQSMTDLYQDTRRRTSLNAWSTLFKEPIFWDVDLSKSVKLATLNFVIENPSLPANVLYLIDQNIDFNSEHAAMMNGKDRPIAEQFATIVSTAHLRFDQSAFTDIDCKFSDFNAHLKLRRQFEDILIFEHVELEKLEQLLAARDPQFDFDFLLDQSLAKQYSAQHQDEKAIALLESLREKVESTDVLNMLARIKFDNGDTAHAHELYRKTLTLDPENLMASKGSGLCFYQEQQHSIAIDILEQVEEHAFADIEVKAYLTKARSEHFETLSREESPDNLIERAELLYGLERYNACYWLFGEITEETKGLKKFFKRVEKEPEAIRLLRARASAKSGHEGHAVELFCSVIDDRLAANENIMDVLKDMLALCSYHITAEQVEEYVLDHIDDLMLAAQANSETDPDYWLAVGLGHFRITRKLTLDDEDRATHDQRTIFAFNQLVAIKPHSADYHLERGYVFGFVKQYEQSIVSNKIAAKAYMYNQGIHMSMGNCYRFLKKYDEAFDAFAAEMSLCNNDKQRSKVYENIALTHYDKQDYKKAVKNFNSYRTLSNTNHIEDTMFMSKLCFLMEDADEKRESYTQNLMDWHHDAIEDAQRSEHYDELYINSPDFMQTIERAVVIAKKSFPPQVKQYERLLKKVKKSYKH